jgi:hypothetical protein
MSLSFWFIRRMSIQISRSSFRQTSTFTELSQWQLCHDHSWLSFCCRTMIQARLCGRMWIPI